MKNKNWLLDVLSYVAIGLVFSMLFVTGSNGEVQKQKPNTFGTVSYFENPNTYMYGAIVGGAFVQSDKRIGTNLMFQPAHTFLLFTQSVLFCGNIGPSVKGNIGTPVVVTYETKAHEMVNGIACHNFVSINKVEDTDVH